MNQSTPPISNSVGPSSTSNVEPSTGANYAFLVHSQDTLPRNLPPTVDNAPLARQKRRRTSPEDQAILEEEYQRNPKPDKVARMNIVNRVALGEKEVQIWFQNRRQNTRRRAKPLSPDELPNPKNNNDPVSSQETETTTVPRMAAVISRPSDPSAPADPRNGGIEPPVQLNDKLVRAKPGPIGNEQPRPTSSSVLQRYSSQAATSLNPSQSSHADFRSGSLMTSSQDSINSLATEVSELSGKDTHGAENKANMRGSGYNINRRGSSYGPVSVKPNSDKFHFRSEAAHQFSMSKDIFSSQTSGSRVTYSNLPRLRLSVDGKAQLVTEEDDILSWAKALPPANHFQRSRGLQRSQSAVYFGQKIASSASGPDANIPRRPGMSRSKTSRPWELYCDDDTKGEIKAEGNQSGSAATATAQVKAGNDAGLLRPNANKRNAQMSRFEPSKRIKTNADGGGLKTKRPSLVRSSSSLPRLQTQSDGSKARPKKTKPNSTKVGLAVLGSPSGDSDKENWAPDDDGQVNGGRPTTVPQGRIGMQGQLGASQGCGTAKNEVGGSSGGKQLNSTADHSESASLSEERGKQPSVGIVSGGLDILTMPRNAEDLDCVQNLLSLSQGNWQ